MDEVLALANQFELEADRLFGDAKSHFTDGTPENSARAERMLGKSQAYFDAAQRLRRAIKP